MKVLMKKALLVAVVLLLACSMGVFAGGQKESAGGAEEESLTIGFDAFNVVFTWMKFAHDAMLEESDNLGIEMIVLDSENEASKQASNMEDLVALGVDGIIANPIDVNSLTPAINNAAEAGVPVATFDRAALDSEAVLYVGCNDVQGGRLVADFVADKLGEEGKIVLITGSPGSSPQLDRSKGFKEQLMNYPDMEIAFEQTGEFFREKGMRVMEDAITAVPDFDAVVCQNDDMMMGAIQAIQSAGIDVDDVVITGYDGVPDGLRAVRDGLADCTVQYPIGQAPEALRRLVDYIRGTPPENKFYEMDPWIITQDNIETGDFYSLIEGE